MIGKEERLAKNDLHFPSNVKCLRMFLMPVQLETRHKCLTTFCYRLYPSVLKTADDLMQIVIVFLHSPQRSFLFCISIWGSPLHLLQKLAC